MSGSLAQKVGILGWNYNRTNFKYDQTLRWQRFTSGRKQAISQIDMFREDVADLSGVTTGKLKVYGPIYGIVVTVCVTVFVEGRSGLKFPGPPVFISGIYHQCLGVGMCFVILACWLLFHAAMRAQIACVQLRTRIVRLPVPTQRQLDGSRKLLSSYEEQGLYDMFRVPFVMPNGSNSPEVSDDEDDNEAKKTTGYNKGGIPGVAHKIKSKVKEAHEAGETTHSARMPGFTPGNPGWYDKELKDREAIPESSPSGQGMNGLEEPYAHFELLRNAQKEWWGCEAYMRVCFLFGMMHLVMAFSYWITLHNIAELGMIWCSNLGAAGLTAGVWIIFRLDVLPEYGGAFPVEIGGPFVTSIAMGLMYSQQITQTMMDIARGVAILIVIMHILLTFRMYSVAKPTNTKAHHGALEAGGRLFNQSGSCEAPSWLPSAFQHVMYLIAPPKTEEQLEKEKQDRENATIEEDPLARVDMTPWYYLRTMIFVVGLAWTVQLAGRAVECVMGERMLVSNPGQPPWSRTGQWAGWEHGPISSKHYAHVTPQRGHWAWQRGWGPQGQQELWASDMFGFAPEADAWWAEDEGPEPRVGAAGFGENTWAGGVLAYGQGEAKWGKHHESKHDWDDSGGHRRLFGLTATLNAERPVVPVPVQWPALLEPDHIACGPSSTGGLVAALTSSGAGALVPSGTAAGRMAGAAVAFALEGLMELGMARSITWGRNGLTALTGSGNIASCPMPSSGAGSWQCSKISAPPVPGFDGVSDAMPAAALDVGSTLRAAVARRSGHVALLELVQKEMDSIWQEVGMLHLPEPDADVVAVTATEDHVLVSVSSGAAYKWMLQNGVPTTEAPIQDTPVWSQRKWQSACVLPDSKIMRLASTWQRSQNGAAVLRPELVL
jgi:hypothetical protein